MRYQPEVIEPKTQKKWDDAHAFRTPTDLSELKKKPKFYVLDMFPYPSGAGLHVGHPEGYTATDVVARLKRMQGFHEVLPGLGAFALRPRQDADTSSGSAALTAFLQEVVADVADRSSAREQQSFHTFKTYEQPFPGAVEERRALYELVPERAADGKARHTPLR